MMKNKIIGEFGREIQCAFGYTYGLSLAYKHVAAVRKVFTNCCPSDMDAEIAALEKRRDKTIVIKQGMMQQLLTGKVRLLKSE